MTTNLTIGSPIETYTLTIRRLSPQGFILQWFEDKELTDPKTELNGTIMQIIIGRRDAPEKVFQATCVNHVSTFHVTPEDSDLEYNKYDGLILNNDGGVETALVNLSIVVGPS